MKPLIILWVTTALAGTAFAQFSTVDMIVRPNRTESKISRGRQTTFNLTITVRNNKRVPLTGVVVDWWVFKTVSKDLGTTKTIQGLVTTTTTTVNYEKAVPQASTQTIDIPALGSKVIETDVVQFARHDSFGRDFSRGDGKQVFVDFAGEKFMGYGVRVRVDGVVVAEKFDPVSLQKTIQTAGTALSPAAMPQPATPNAPVAAIRFDGLYCSTQKVRQRVSADDRLHELRWYYRFYEDGTFARLGGGLRVGGGIKAKTLEKNRTVEDDCQELAKDHYWKQNLPKERYVITGTKIDLFLTKTQSKKASFPQTEYRSDQAKPLCFAISSSSHWGLWLGL